MTNGADGADRPRAPRPAIRFGPALAAISAAALVIRVLFITVVRPVVPKLGDASAYHLLANNLASSKGYVRPFDLQLLGLVHPTAEYPPLFPLLLAVPSRFGLHSVEQQRLFMAVVGAATVALLGLLGRRVAGDSVGLVAAAIAACYPMLFQSEGILMAEGLYVALVVAVLLGAYRAHDAPSPINYALLGAAIGLAALTRSEGLVVGFLVVAGLAIRNPGPVARRAGSAALTIGVALIVLMPWTVRNAGHFHTFIPLANNSATLVDGANCDSTYSGAELGLWRTTLGAAGPAAPQAQACFEGFDITDPGFDEAAVARHHRWDGLQYATDHLRALPKVATVRVLRTFGAYAVGQQMNFEALEGRPHEWQLAGTVMYWCLVPLAVAGGVLAWRRRLFVWPLVATVVAVVVISAATYGQQRFRVAAEPALVVFAAVALVAAAQRARLHSPARDA